MDEYNLKGPVNVETYGPRINEGAVIDVFNFCLARAFVLTPTLFSLALRRFKVPESGLLEPEKRYEIKLPYGGDRKYITRISKIEEMTPTEKEFVVGERLKVKSDDKLYWGSLRRVVKNVDANLTNISGNVVCKTKKGKERVTVMEPYESSESPLTSTRCSCIDDLTDDEENNEILTYTCLHAASLITGSYSDSHLLPTTERRVFMPFNLSRQLMTEVLFAYYVAEMKPVEISKQLLQREGIFSEAMQEFIEQGVVDL